ncbi:MAG TPA: hypothetical protein VIL35_08645 [Vicinamibacterales bacterium]
MTTPESPAEPEAPPPPTPARVSGLPRAARHWILESVYGTQALVTENLQRLSNGPLTMPAIYDPASRAAAVRLLWLTLADIQSAEAMLLARYREHLPAIGDAAAKYR